MTRLHELKKELAVYEESKQWGKLLMFLRNMWNENKSDGINCALILEEMFWAITSISDMEVGQVIPTFKGIEEYADQCYELIQDVAAYGLVHCTNDPFFLWRVGILLSRTPYMLYGVAGLNVLNSGEIGCEMVTRAARLQPDNMLFQEAVQRLTGNFGWLDYATDEVKYSIRTELAKLQLQENLVDQEILFEYKLVFDE